MKRTRGELKSQAKDAIRHNYWKIVLVSLLLILLTGGLTSSAETAGAANGIRASIQAPSYSYQYDYPSAHDDFFDRFEDGYEDHGFMEDPFDDPFFEVPGAVYIFAAALLFALIAVILSALLDILIFSPLKVGLCRFFLVNLSFPANIGEIGFAYDHSYKTTVKTMFLRGLKLFFWTLLFIIPGIIKSYEYRLIPYLLAERPDLSSREVFRASCDLMRGNKWRAFVLDLSFILWHILNAFTAGMLGIFYLNPYINMTNAAFYRSVCEESFSNSECGIRNAEL